MLDLLSLQTLIQDTTAALASLERAAATSPDDPSLAVAGVSLRRRQEELEAEFLRTADALGVDVCSYRLFALDASPKVGPVGSALTAFQSLVSSVYAAIRAQRPLQRSRPSPEVLAATEFEIGYVFSGSVGFVLTIPNARLLIGESYLDEAVGRVFKMATAETPEEIAVFASDLGPAAVRELYRWTDVLASHQLGADLDWRRGSEIRAGLDLPPARARQLRDTIALTSEAEDETLLLVGELVGIDTAQLTFHFRVPEAEDIRGTLDSALAFREPAKVPAAYRVQVIKTTRVRYSTEEDEVRYVLTAMVPL